jgi:hypothetical protein
MIQRISIGGVQVVIDSQIILQGKASREQVTSPVISDEERILREEIKQLERRITSLGKEIRECNQTILLKHRAIKNLGK